MGNQKDSANKTTPSSRACPPSTERQTWAEIDLRALTDNYSGLCSLISPSLSSVPSQSSIRYPRIIPVIKADAYGHGAIQVAGALAETGVEILAVGNVEEGVALRQAGVSEDILVLSTIWRGQESPALEHRLILTVDSIENIEYLSIAAEEKAISAAIHIKIDTGMGRLGIRWDSMEPFLHALRQSQHVSLEGVFTHLSSADELDPTYTLKQKDRFEIALSEIQKSGLDPGEIHCANSSGLLYHDALRQWSSRIGIALYGYAPVAENSPANLRPALSLKTKVGPLRQVNTGEAIGYGRRFITSRKTRYATLPIGYADGLPRRLSGNCRVIIRDKWAEVIGTISMDMITVDLTDRPDVREGDEVILLGSGGDCSITADTWAKAQETIPYEILCGIAARVPRIYI